MRQSKSVSRVRRGAKKNPILPREHRCRSNPIQSNPIRSNAVRSNLSSACLPFPRIASRRGGTSAFARSLARTTNVFTMIRFSLDDLSRHGQHRSSSFLTTIASCSLEMDESDRWRKKKPAKRRKPTVPSCRLDLERRQGRRAGRLLLQVEPPDDRPDACARTDGWMIVMDGCMDE